MKHAVLFAAVLAAAPLAAEEYYTPPRVKLIHDGWGFQYQPLFPGQTPSRKMTPSTASIRKNITKIEKEVGVIDILVNNAGIIKRIPMCDMTAAEFRQVIDVDLNAPFIVSKADRKSVV